MLARPLSYFLPTYIPYPKYSSRFPGATPPSRTSFTNLLSWTPGIQGQNPAQNTHHSSTTIPPEYFSGPVLGVDFVGSQSPTYPLGFVTRTYSLTALCLSSGKAVTDSVMTASKRSSSKGRSCATATTRCPAAGGSALARHSLCSRRVLLATSYPQALCG